MELRTKKIIALEGLIFLGIHIVAWIIAWTNHDNEWVPKIVIPYLVIRFIVWAIKTLRQKDKV